MNDKVDSREEGRAWKHPMQPLVKASDGCIRFQKNAIVRHLLDNGGIDMNMLACMDFDDEDRQQFAQLIGYSQSGYSELSYVTDEAWERVPDTEAAHPTDTQPAPGAFDTLIKKLTETADWAENTNPHLRNRTAELLREAAAALASHKPQPATIPLAEVVAEFERDPEFKAALDEARKQPADSSLDSSTDSIGNGCIGSQPAASGGVDGPVRLLFPTMLRKMWSGCEVQDWLDAQGPLYAEPGFFMDHGLWHDKQTGQHLYTQDQYDELRRDAFNSGYASREEELALSAQPAASGVDEREALDGVNTAAIKDALDELDDYRIADLNHRNELIPIIDKIAAAIGYPPVVEVNGYAGLTPKQKQWCIEWEQASEYDPMYLDLFMDGEIDFNEVVRRNNRWLDDHLQDIYRTADAVADQIFEGEERYE